MCLLKVPELYKLGDVYYMTVLLYLADEPDYYANNMCAFFLNMRM